MFAKQLYQGLMNLMDLEDKPFFYEDTPVTESLVYRVFCYGIPSYTQYQLPFAKETRGSMFLVDKNTDEMKELIALPMHKFFTYGEQPETANLDLSKTKYFTLKPDGSLLSSYIDIISGELKFKTKRKPNQSSFNEILDEVLYKEFKEELKNLTDKGFTIDCELTSPKNRVILEYKEAKLTVLKVRNKSNGEFVDILDKDFQNEYPHIAKNTVEQLDKNILLDLTKRNRNLDIKGIEGGVVEMEDGTLAKVKTMYYLTQNRYANIQDLSKQSKLLVEACLEETFDELRTLFHYRNRSENYNIEGILAAMDSIEKQVNETYNPLYSKIMGFYEEHKELNIKEYTDKAKAENMQQYMGVLMPLKKEGKANIKQFYINTIGKKVKV